MTIAETVMEYITPRSDAEYDRLASRRHARERLAQIDRELIRRRAALAKLAACETQKKQADAKHSEVCDKLLAERREIEARQNALAGNREPLLERDENRLREIEDEISNAGDALHLAISAVEVAQKQLAAQLGDDANQHTIGKLSAEKSNLENDLRGKLGNPALRLKVTALVHLKHCVRHAAELAAAGRLAEARSTFTAAREVCAAAEAEAQSALAKLETEIGELLQKLDDE